MERTQIRSVFGLLFVTFPMGLIVYGLNDIADRESDLINPRKGGIEGSVFKHSQLKLISISIIVFTLLFLGLYILVGNYISLIPLFLIVLFAYLYSFKPIRLKSKPIFDSLSNSLWMLFVYLLGVTSVATSFNESITVPKNIWLLLLGIFAAHAISTLPDYAVDKEAGDKTISGLLTLRGTALLSSTIFIVILVLLKPINLAFQIYLLISALLCASIFLKPHKNITYYAVWGIFLGFPIACLYTFLFDISLLRDLLR